MKTPALFSLKAAPMLAAAIATMLSSHVAQAADGTWSNDGNSLWDTTTNWTGGIVASGSGATANFNTLNITADRTVSLDSARTIGTLIFGDATSSHGWLLDGGSAPYILTLAGTTPTITVNPLATGKVAAISAEIAGTSGLTKSGAGPLTLSGVNTYTGTTTVNAGTLLVTGSLNGTTGTALTFAGSGTLNVSEASGVSQSMGALTFSAGDGTVQSTYGSDSGIALTFASLSARTAGATANFVVSGGTNGTDNKIVLSNTTNAPLGGSSGTSNDPGLFFGGSGYARYDATNGYFSAVAYGSDSNANASLSGVQTTLGTIGSSKDAQYVGSANPTTTSGTATSNSTTLPVADGTKFLVGQIITGTGINENTYITAIGGNTLTLSRAAAVAAGTTLTPYNSVSAQTTDSLNTLNLSGVGPTLTLAAGQTLSVNSILRSAGTSGAPGAISLGTAIRPVVSGGELVVRTDTANDNLAIFSDVQNVGTLTKTGAGTLTLDGTKTYTGKIIVNGGTLGITTDTSLGATGSSAPDRITLNNGATLRKVTIGSAFTINANRGITLGEGMQYITNAGGAAGHLVLGSVITGPGGMTYAADNNAIRISAANTYTGDTWLNNGATLFNLQAIQNSTLAGSTATQPWSPTGTYVFGGLKGSSNLTLKASIGLSIGNNNQDTTYSGILGGAAGDLGITKIGTGTLTLAGANTYSGTTTVSAGTLALGAAGSVNNTSGITLAAGALLDTTAKSSYAMPASPKSITFHVDGAGAGSCGRIHAAGLDITSAVVVLTVDNPLDDPAYILADYTSCTGSAFASVTPPEGYTLDYAYNGGTQIALVYDGSGPAPLHHFDVTASSPQTAGATFSVTVTAKDASGNTLTTDNSTVVTMTSNGSAQFDSNGDDTFGDNTQTLTSGTFTIHTKDNVAEGVTLAATAGDKTGSSSSITVDPAALHHFAVTTPGTQTAGTAFNITAITAQDVYGNTVTGFDGTVAMTETGGGTGGTVTPPTSSAFDAGVRSSQSVTLSKAGTGVTLTVSNSAGSETGISDAFTVQSQFAAWGGGVAFDTDANSDGVANGLAWLLGAANPSANSASLLPKPSRSLNGDLVMTFRCLKAAKRGTAIPYVQYSKDLGQADFWSGHQAAVPESTSTVGDVIFTVTANGDYDDIIATIPAAAAASGGKLFGRLHATE